MSPERQRIAIAEACPEIFKFNCMGAALMRDNSGVWVFCDILNDLNAMHEAEKTLTIDQLIDQAEWLGVSSNEMHMKAWVILLRATAAQRAEAFLRAIKKWEDDK